jgi:MFS family permease
VNHWKSRHRRPKIRDPSSPQIAHINRLEIGAAERHAREPRSNRSVNSAIDELIPAKYRGRIDLIVNGSFWLGAAGGALASPFLLDQHLFPANIGWRLGFGIGGALGLSILLLRRFVPESPRWLVTHCRSEEAEATVQQIEAHVAKSTGRDLSPVNEKIEVHPRKAFGLGLILTSMLGRYRRRSILALVLMVAQSFLYNSVFFTFGLILAHFYNVPNERVGFYLFVLAIGNFCGPLLLGSFFDTVGRKKMIAGTFAISVGCRPNGRVVCYLLFCVGSRKFCLPHSERDISSRNPRSGHCMLLCARHRHWRKRFAPLNWLAD